MLDQRRYINEHGQSVPVPSWASGPLDRPIAPRDMNAPVTSGFYAAVIVNSEERKTFASERYAVFTFMLIGGEHGGKTVEDTFRLHDLSPDVRDGEYQRLANLCHALNTPRIGASSKELHGIPLELVVFTQGRTTIVQGYASAHPVVEVLDPQHTRWRK